MTKPCPALISLSAMRDLFPDVNEQTIYRWNSTQKDRGRALPPADLMAGNTPLWFEDTIIEWAKTRRKGVVLDRGALEKIRADQGVLSDPHARLEELAKREVEPHVHHR